MATLCYFEVTFKELEKKKCVTSVECLMIQLSPSQEIGNLKPKTQKPQNKNTTRLSVFERTSKKKKKRPSDFSCFVKVESFLKEPLQNVDNFHNFAKLSSLKEPQEKCNQFSYFEKSSFFEETSKQIQGKFFTNLLHINFFFTNNLRHFMKITK